MQRLKENLQELLLSFYYVCPGDQTHVIRFGGKFLYQLSRLPGPWSGF